MQFNIDSLKLIPVVSAVIYLIGYVSFSAYLSYYGIDQTEIFNLSFLKTGILFTLLFFPIVLIVLHYNQTPTDDFSKNWLEHKSSFFVTLYFIIFVLECFIKIHLVHYSVIVMYFFVFSLLTSQLTKSWSKKLKDSLVLLPIFAYCICVFWKGQIQSSMYLFLSISFYIITILTYGEYGDKVLKPIHLPFRIIIVLSSATLFGMFVLNGIPINFGGAKHVMKVLIYKDENKPTIAKILPDSSIVQNTTKVLSIIYENAEYYYINLNDSTTITIARDLFSGEYIPRRK